MMVTAAIGALSLQQYDEAGSVAFLFSVSEFLEAQASTKARKALKNICDLRPDHANVIHPVTKEIVVVPADRVPLGSSISVKTGDKIAADGIIIEGSSSIDESSLTGESVPIQKNTGDPVKGGTINIGRTQLVIRTTTTVEDSAVSRLIRLVEDAQSNRSPTEKLIDSFARSYTPSVMFVAVLMCTIPWFSGVENGRHWMLNGLIIVVIACPCSLTISTPVTYAAGLAATAQRGIIVKGGAKLEAMGSVDKIVFDKTGTLTKGKFSVVHLEVVGTSKPRQEMLELLALIQERSSHPVAACLVQAAKDEGVMIPRHKSLSDHTILKGEGVCAKVDGETVFVGNQRLFERLGIFISLVLNYQDLARTWSATGSMVGFVGTMNDGILGIFCVKDAIREEARAVIQGFQDAYIDTMICTGDSDAVAQAVAQELGIPPVHVHSQLLPEDKLHFIGSLKRPQPQNYALCREKRYVLFCGDGVNDAPALAVSDIGCSMGEGAAIAMEMSDVTLMDSNLSKLLFAINMGQRVLRTVKENILISLVGKLAVVIFTFTGRMTLLLAIASDVGVMLIVTLNGMKLLSSRGYDSPTTSGPLLRNKPGRHGIEMDSYGKNIELPTFSDAEVI
jgi:Cd2+/Zn2+-exporting ATPase